ncbi:MAG: mechanosensitive ion channel family protein [Gemmatimonadetes bacterium]|nr:mechanosensitive ion channel family protein [Gemmatimonadota bacterium]
MIRSQDEVAPDTTSAVVDVEAALSDAWAKVTDWTHGVIESLPNLLAALVVLLVFLGLGTVVRNVVGRIMDRLAHQPEVSRVVAAAAYVAVLGIGIVLALGTLNLDKTVTSLLAGAGILGLALGFAFQDIAENFIAGVVLNVQDQFSEGDIIESNDYMGMVERVQLRATTVRTFQGQRVLIPNAMVFKNPLINFSEAGRRRIDIPVGVAYGDDLEKARRVAIEAVETLDYRDTTQPVDLFYEEFGDSSINFQIRFWISFSGQVDFLRARSDAIMAIKSGFDREGITIPFPIRTLDFGGHVVGGQGLAGALRESGARPGGA